MNFFQTFGLISESKIWCQVGSILDLVWFQSLRLFGSMFDLFWDHLGFPGPESILGNLVLWDSMLGALRHRFGSLDASKGSILRVLGSLWASFLMTFEGPEAPGHAPGASLCSKGGLDPFLERFWEPNGRPRAPKTPPKINLKINKISTAFFDGILIAKWRQK